MENDDEILLIESFICNPENKNIISFLDKKKRLRASENLAPTSSSSSSPSNGKSSTRLNTGNFTIDTVMVEFEQMITLFFHKKESLVQYFTHATANELIRKTAIEIIKLSSKLLKQEEKQIEYMEKITQQEERISALMQQLLHA